jgi:hypothetical protein
MSLLSKSEIQEQSVKAHDRWKEIWAENASNNAKNHKQFQPIEQSGTNRKLIIVSFGTSLKENLTDIKKHNLHFEYDIMCIDKSLKTCLEFGIIPKYCVMSDAQVNFEEWGLIDKNICRSVILLSALTANYKWSEYWLINQGQVYFYLNKDHLRTHRIYGEYLEGKQAFIIPASSNVGNAAYVLSSLVLGYKKILLAAYNYSFPLFGDYYGSQNETPIDTNMKLKKHSFCNHFSMIDLAGEVVQCSYNMQFSAKWLIGFIDDVSRRAGIETTNITGAGILKINNQAKFTKEKIA